MARKNLHLAAAAGHCDRVNRLGEHAPLRSDYFELELIGHRNKDRGKGKWESSLYPFNLFPRPLSLFLNLLAFLEGCLNRADHVKRLLGQIVVLAFDDLFETFNRVFQFHVLAFAARELRSHVEWLREKLLNLARA